MRLSRTSIRTTFGTFPPPSNISTDFANALNQRLAINLIATDLMPTNTRVCRLSGSPPRIRYKRSGLDYCGQKQRPTRANGTDCQSRLVPVVGQFRNNTFDHGNPHDVSFT